MPIKASDRRKVYLKRKEDGLCPRCGNKVKKSSKFIYCDDCRSFFRSYNNEISESVNKARKALYDKRKKMKQCPRCGKQLGKKYTKKICPKCLDKQYKYNYGTARTPVVKKGIVKKSGAVKAKKKTPLRKAKI